tara:strand:- start:6475 stop:7467 length:993 start_codon:yes stop_codon:yes gene_type:complete
LKNKNFVEENVIFLISLPRSGSTLLQSIIGGHSYVHTTPEPWITLPLLYSQKQNGVESEYDHITATIASSEFFESMLNGQKVLKEARINYLTTIYKQIIEESGKRFYLDKTSRNYLVIKELKELFPNGKFIFLIRNPISVFASYLNFMVFNNWSWFSKPNFKKDLLDGYQFLAEGIKRNKKNNFLISYEKFINHPKDSLVEICNFLEIPFEKDMINYQNCLKKMKGRLIDPKAIHKHKNPVKKYIDSWRKTIDTPFKSRIVNEFIDIIGDKNLNSLGYKTKSLRYELKYNDQLKDDYPEVSLNLLLKSKNKLSKFEKAIIDSFLDKENKK